MYCLVYELLITMHLQLNDKTHLLRSSTELNENFIETDIFNPYYGYQISLKLFLKILPHVIVQSWKSLLKFSMQISGASRPILSSTIQ